MSASEFDDRIKRIEESIQYTFKDKKQILLALTHRSFSGSESKSLNSNQRLEFLGDAVLQLIITQELYQRYPEHDEGPLTKARAQLVNRRTLADLASKIDLGSQLMMSRGEELSGGRERPSALADAFEAVVGAVFVDSSFERTYEFVIDCFSEHFGELQILPNLENPKGELQEYLQTQSNRPPHYELIRVTGPDHDRFFECAVVHDKKELGRGSGKSKKEAEFNAAIQAMEHFRSHSTNEATAK
jgi:ribonuclease-3